MSAGAELRVLEGLHAGAVVTLPDAASPLTLGSDESNAVILRDAPFATATLTADDAGWLLHLGERTVTLQPGDGVRLAPLALAIVAANASWAVDAVNWIAEPESVAPAHEPLSAAAHEGDDRTTANVETPTVEAAPSAIAAAPVPRSGRSRGAYLVAGAATLAVVIAVSVGMLASSAPAPSESPAPAALATPAVDPAAVQDVIRAAGFGDVVRALPRDDGRVTLRGVLTDEETQEALLKAVSKVTRRVVLNLMTQAEFAQRVQAVGPLLPEGVEATATAGGVVALRGQVDNAEDIGLARSTMETELPEATAVNTAALTVRQPEPAVVAPRAPAAPKLPKFVAVQGGTNSYVMLASGERLLPGASINGYRLAAIEDSAIVVEDRGGRRYRIPR